MASQDTVSSVPAGSN